jgi:hypothetical protein
VKTQVFLSLQGTGPNQPSGEITHLAWNNKVQHILASTSGAGSTVVWDLKKQKPVISFSDPQRCMHTHASPICFTLCYEILSACFSLVYWLPLSNLFGRYR